MTCDKANAPVEYLTQTVSGVGSDAADGIE